MEAPDQVQKKRPSHIRIPSPGPQPIILGPNAFAIAERAAQAKQDIQREIEEAERLQLQPTSDVGEQNAPTNEGEMSPGLRPKEAFSNLFEGIRRTPNKGKQRSSSSEYSAASGPQYNEHGSLNAPSTQKPLGGFGPVPTARAEIEARREPKYIKMMEQLSEATSTNTAPYSDGNIQVNDYRPGNSTRSSRHSGHEEIASKSPKKKIFGMNIPFTSRSAPKLPTPPMKFKASKFLGVTPPAKSKKHQILASIKSSATAPRSETSKSLPTQLFSQNDPHASRRSPPRGARRSPPYDPRHSPPHGSRRSPPHGTRRSLKSDKSPPLSRARRRSPPTYPPVFSHLKTLRALTGAEEPEVPPLPPRKDSLPFVATEKSPFVATEKSSSISPKKSSFVAAEKSSFVSPKKSPFVPTEKPPFIATEKSSSVSPKKSPFVAAEKSSFVAADKSPFVAADKSPFVAADKSPFVAADKSPFVAAEKPSFVATEKSTFVATKKSSSVSPKKSSFIAAEKSPFVATEQSSFVAAEKSTFVATEKSPFVSAEKSPSVTAGQSSSVMKSASVKKSDSVQKSVTLVTPKKESTSPKKKKAMEDYFEPGILELLTPPVPDHKPEDFTDMGMKVRPPSVFSLESSPRGSSPRANDDDENLSDLQETVLTARASLVEGLSIDSAHATVERLSGLSSDSSFYKMLFPGPPPRIVRGTYLGPPDDWRTVEPAAPVMELLKPTVYVPPQAAVREPVDPAPLNPTSSTHPTVAVRDFVNPPPELKPTLNIPPEATARDPVKPGSQLTSMAGDMHPGAIVNETVTRSLEQTDQLRRSNTRGSDRPAPPTEFGFIPITFCGELDDIDPQSEEVQEFRRIHNISPRVKHVQQLQQLQQDQQRTQYQTYQERVGDADHIARVMAGFRVVPPVPASAPVQNPRSQFQTPGPSSAPVWNPGSGSLRTGQSSARLNPTGLQRSSTFSTPSRNMGMQGTLTGQPYPGSSSQWMPRPAHEGETSVSAHIQKMHEHIDLVVLSTLDQVTKKQDESAHLVSAKHEEMKATVDEQIKDIKSLVTSLSEQMQSRNTQVHHIQQSLDELGSYIGSEVIDTMQDQTARMDDLEQRLHGMELSVAALQVSSRRMLAERHVPLRRPPRPEQVRDPPIYVSPRRPPRPEQAPVVSESRSRPNSPSLYDRSDPFQSTALLAVPSHLLDSPLSRAQRAAADNRESRSSYHAPGSGAGAPQQPLRQYPPTYDSANPFGRQSESQE